LPSGSSMEPGIFGIIRPVLLWPEGIAGHMDDAHLESVLAHEVCHVQRRDNLTCAIHMLVEAIFWFHPLVWWMERQLVKERERACDEAVLQLGNEAEVYAESILNVCKFYTESPTTCISGVMGSELKQRITRIVSGQGERKLDLRRKLLLTLVCVLAVGLPLTAGLVNAEHGQAQETEKNSITGTWQGTMRSPDGQTQRVVLKIENDNKGGLSTVFYNLDQREQAVFASSSTFESGTLRFAIDFPRLIFEGKMSDDGKSIGGTVTQSGSFPLTLQRATPGTEWATPSLPLRIQPMAPDARPDVEVATVKPTEPGTRMFMLTMRDGDLLVKNLSLNSLIRFAYQVQTNQVIAGAGWIDTDKWDIEAKPDTPGKPSVQQEKEFLRKLMAERFALGVHEEKREMPAYALTVGNSGPKMTRSADPTLSPNFSVQPSGVLRFQSATMEDFVGVLHDILDRPVIDETGLAGKWDFVLQWTPDETQFAGAPMKVTPPASDDASAAPPLFRATQEQLGLKLEARKAQVPVVVIDHVDHPSPN
jgi:uncharacterized protein (TIGR03435 family)